MEMKAVASNIIDTAGFVIVSTLAESNKFKNLKAAAMKAESITNLYFLVKL